MYLKMSCIYLFCHGEVESVSVYPPEDHGFDRNFGTVPLIPYQKYTNYWLYTANGLDNILIKQKFDALALQ